MTPHPPALLDKAEVLAVLALARPYIEEASGLMYDGTNGHGIREEAKRRLARLDALYKMMSDGASGLSDFIRNASPDEKQAVYGKVMDKVVEQQKAVIAAAPPMLRESAGNAVAPVSLLSRADEQYRKAIALVFDSGRASVSMVQRRLNIRYSEAQELIVRMLRDGIVAIEDTPGAALFHVGADLRDREPDATNQERPVCTYASGCDCDVPRPLPQINKAWHCPRQQAHAAKVWNSMTVNKGADRG